MHDEGKWKKQLKILEIKQLQIFFLFTVLTFFSTESQLFIGSC